MKYGGFGRTGNVRFQIMYSSGYDRYGKKGFTAGYLPFAV